MSDMRPTWKIITLKVDHDPSGICFVTSERLPGFFLSTKDDDSAYLRMQAALEAFVLARFGRTVQAKIAEEIGAEADFGRNGFAQFVADWDGAEAA